MVKKLLSLIPIAWCIADAQAPAAKPNMLEVVSPVKPIQKIVSDYCGLQLQFTDSKWKNVISCAFSPDGKYLAIALEKMLCNNFVYIFDARTFVPIYKLAHTTAKSIIALAYAANGKTLACCDKTGKLFLWDTTNFIVKKRTKLFAGPKSVSKIEFMGDTQLVTIDPDRKSELYLFDTETETGSYISGAEQEITACAVKPVKCAIESSKYSKSKQLDTNSNSAKHIVCASESALTIYTLGGKSSNKLVRPEVLPQETEIKVMCYSPDGNYIASTGEDNEIVIHDLTKQSVFEKIDANGEINALAFSPDGSLVAADPAGLRLYVPMMLAQDDLTTCKPNDHSKIIHKVDTAITITPDKHTVAAAASAKYSAAGSADDEASLRLVRKLEEEASLQLAKQLQNQSSLAQSRHSAAQALKYTPAPKTMTVPSVSDIDPVNSHEKKLHAEMVQQAFSGLAQYWIKNNILTIQYRLDNTQIIAMPTRLKDTTKVKLVDASILETAFPFETTYYKIENEFLRIFNRSTNKPIGKPRFFQKK